MNVLEAIKTRRSVRRYSGRPITTDKINGILQAAIWTPSGKNGQPWKFKVVTEKTLIDQISTLSIYGSWMKTAPLFVAVFLDSECSYNHTKDVQSCGAAMQNMMLAAHELDIGSCWIGEILAKSYEVKEILKINNSKLNLMGIVVFGYRENDNRVKSERKNIETFLL